MYVGHRFSGAGRLMWLGMRSSRASGVAARQVLVERNGGVVLRIARAEEQRDRPGAGRAGQRGHAGALFAQRIELRRIALLELGPTRRIAVEPAAQRQTRT